MRYLLSLMFLAALAMPAYAAFEGPSSGSFGGFSGPVSGVMADTVEKAKTLPDDARVVLTGNIVSQLAGSKDEYIFRDSTGEITVEISRKLFMGRTVTPDSKVRVSGKVDRDFARAPEIDVKILEVLN